MLHLDSPLYKDIWKRYEKYRSSNPHYFDDLELDLFLGKNVLVVSGSDLIETHREPCGSAHSINDTQVVPRIQMNAAQDCSNFALDGRSSI